MPADEDNIPASGRSGSRPPRRVVDAALAAWGRSGRQSVVAITGHSMRPLLRPGDEALIRHGPAGVGRGDIVAFRLGEAFAAHRVIAVRRREGGTFLLTGGDNNTGFDPEIPLDQLIGRVIAIRRGRQIMRLDTFAWRVAGTVLAWLWLGGRQAQRWVRRIRRPLVGERGKRDRQPGQPGALTRGRRAALRVLTGVLGRWQE